MAGLLVVGLACAIGAAAVHAAQAKSPSPVSLEYAVKATYLYKFAPFVTWPPGEFASTNAPFTICVVGNDPFDGYLERAVAGRGFGGHPFSVRRLMSLTPEAHCQIAFLAQLPAQDIRQALAAVSGQPVLTVVDSATPDREGIVQFVIRQGRVGFEINVGAASRNHLAISSKLLSLALAVRDPS
ncbi:MAG: YfiR family protein [Rhodanobacter sp.]